VGVSGVQDGKRGEGVGGTQSPRGELELELKRVQKIFVFLFSVCFDQVIEVNMASFKKLQLETQRSPGCECGGYREVRCCRIRPDIKYFPTMNGTL